MPGQHPDGSASPMPGEYAALVLPERSACCVGRATRGCGMEVRRIREESMTDSAEPVASEARP